MKTIFVVTDSNRGYYVGVLYAYLRSFDNTLWGFKIKHGLEPHPWWWRNLPIIDARRLLTCGKSD